ncbi:MAG: DUF1176 domain-containing protein, partial [Mesorhizobium sp.]
GYFGDTKPAKDFDSFVKGYDGTDKVEVQTGTVSDEGAAGSIFYNVPVAIRATDKAGGEKVFAGCYTLRQVNAQIQAGPPDKETRLFHFSCSAAAYNESSIYYMTDDVSGVQQLQFAEPKMDIRYENNDSNGKLLGMSIVGFQTSGWAVNSAYDEAAHTITTFNKWRGIGDASDAGTYLFRNGNFSLVQYDVDASYDGEQNPETVIDYNTAP